MVDFFLLIQLAGTGDELQGIKRGIMEMADGIVINKDLNACDENGDAIPGLYVIGNDSGSYFANEYPNLATGMACGRTVTFGRVIGRALAKKA